MRKILAGLILGAMVFMLAACASQDKEVKAPETGTQETESTAVDTQENEIYEGMSMANPWVDSDQAGVLEATGFELIAPAEASNVAYSYMPDTGMAQLNYTMNNAMWVYRMQPADALEDISGIYCEWNYTEETKVAGMSAMEYSYTNKPEGDFVDATDCTRVINWYDVQKKVTYSLAVLGPDLNGLDTAVYAENLFNLAADISNGIAPVSEEAAGGDLYQSYLGTHVCDTDGSSISVDEGEEDGSLKVAVNLYRLCSLDDGTGMYENGRVSFGATDPNGNLIRFCLYYNSDNSLCLEVTEGTWPLLPAGTVIAGFDH